jgi:hypothetical protein
LQRAVCATHGGRRPQQIRCVTCARCGSWPWLPLRPRRVLTVAICSQPCPVDIPSNSSRLPAACMYMCVPLPTRTQQ